jgi:nucleotide-binding universal stress UspA family protein
MSEIKSILVAYDFSDHAKRAMNDAFDLADKFGAKVSVVHVLNSDVADAYVIPLSQEYKEKLSQNLKEDVKAHYGERKISVADEDIFVEKGNPHIVIIEKAVQVSADLVIMGSHGRSAVSLVLLGSVANKVIRYAPMPVLVSRLDREKTFQKILIPIDDSDESEQAIDYVKKFVAAFNSQIQLLHVVDVSDFAHYAEYKIMVKKALDNARGRLEKLNAKHGITMEPLVIDGKGAHTIVDATKQNEDIGLVVMTTHGRSGLSRWFMGSTSEAVARHLPCSVLTMHLQEHHGKVKEHFESYKKNPVGNILI